MPILYALSIVPNITALQNGQTPLPGQDPDCQGQGEIIIAKHRNGSLENIKLRFIPQLAKFTDLDSFGFKGNDVLPSSLNDDNVAPF